jgi:hypothetical protein
MHYYGPYVAQFLTIPLSFAALIPLVLLPETATPRKRHFTNDDNGRSDSPTKKPTLKMRMQELQQHVREDFVPLLKSIPILVGLISFVIGSFATAIGEIIMQYMKVRFGWNYEKVCACILTIELVY